MMFSSSWMSALFVVFETPFASALLPLRTSINSHSSNVVALSIGPQLLRRASSIELADLRTARLAQTSQQPTRPDHQRPGSAVPLARPSASSTTYHSWPDPLAFAHARHLTMQYPSASTAQQLAEMPSPRERERAAALVHLWDASRAPLHERRTSHQRALNNPGHAHDLALIRRYRLGRDKMYDMATIADPGERARWARMVRTNQIMLRTAVGASVGGLAGAIGATIGIQWMGGRDAVCAGEPLKHPKSCSWGKWKKGYQDALAKQNSTQPAVPTPIIH